MWGFLLAYTGELLVSPLRTTPSRSLAGGIAAWTALLFTMAGALLKRPLLSAIPLGFILFALTTVALAYRRVERARDLALDDPREPPSPPPWFLPFALPTSLTLFTLARAIDAIRRGKAEAASELARTIDEHTLRAQEIRLLEGVRALVTLGRGQRTRATERALAALPTGSDDMDACLGRLALASAWGNHVRLGKIDDAWDEAGVGREGEGSLPRLRRLVELHLAPGEPDVEPLPQDERRALALEARAVGDEELARDLEPPTTPHGYR
jgi:hypothetical protein